MSTYKYYRYLDDHPFTGKRTTNFPAMISTAKHLDGFFNGHLNYDQVRNVTRGKVYTIICVEGFGDCSDWSFIDDIGELHTLRDCFFAQADGV